MVWVVCTDTEKIWKYDDGIFRFKILLATKLKQRKTADPKSSSLYIWTGVGEGVIIGRKVFLGVGVGFSFEILADKWFITSSFKHDELTCSFQQPFLNFQVKRLGH